MSALTKDRNTPKRDGDFKVDGVAASTRIFTGALLMRNAGGFLVKGATATGCTGIGRAEEAVDNTGGRPMARPWSNIVLVFSSLPILART